MQGVNQNQLVYPKFSPPQILKIKNIQYLNSKMLLYKNFNLLLTKN
jgi:hypothetical protein